MVIYNERLDLIFGALSDTTRRGILAQLSEGEQSVGALATPYEVSQPAISKHLRVLERAGLIRRVREGREHRIQVNAGPVEEARDWISYYARLWKQHFDAVDDYLKEQAEAEK